MIKLLLVEDDLSLAQSLIYYLESEGFDVVHVNTLKGAKAQNFLDYALILLDVNLPDGLGYELLEPSVNTPIIFLTALDDDKDIVRGFEIGAADYITKPFKPGELVARIKRNMKPLANELTFKDIKVDLDMMTVYKENTLLNLSANEYKLLLYFLDNKNKVLKRAQVLDFFWDSNMQFVNDNTLTVNIKRLREKLGKDVIKTVRGIGYILTDKDE